MFQYSIAIGSRFYRDWKNLIFLSELFRRDPSKRTTGTDVHAHPSRPRTQQGCQGTVPSEPSLGRRDHIPGGEADSHR